MLWSWLPDKQIEVPLRAVLSESWHIGWETRPFQHDRSFSDVAGTADPRQCSNSKCLGISGDSKNSLARCRESADTNSGYPRVSKTAAGRELNAMT